MSSQAAEPATGLLTSEQQPHAAADALADSRRTRSRRWILLTAVVAVALGIAAVLIAVSSSGPSTARQSPAAIEQLFAGIPQHGALLGQPSAPVKVTEFADLQCPFCRDYTLSIFPRIVRRYVRTGKVSIRFDFMNRLGPQSDVAAKAGVSASDQNMLWNFIDVFYNDQGVERTGYVTSSFLAKIGDSIPGFDTSRMMRDRIRPAAAAAVREDQVRAVRDGAKGTPSFLIQRAGHPSILLLGDPAVESVLAKLVAAS